MENKEMEISFGAKDSELIECTYHIPEGMEAIIEGDKVIIRKKESEDEKTRKEIISLVLKVMGREKDNLNDENYDKMLDWLEKQGEQKPTDKVEPKFHKGDWAVSNLDGNARRISEVHFDEYNSYYVVDGKSVNLEEYDRLHHLWSIQDAKPGDVLVDSCQGFNNPFIFILKKFETVDFGLTRPSDFSSYCCLTMSDKQKFKEGAYHHMHDGIKPATKEQRDLLFSKMKEEGYEWDAEKKELKKIHVIDEGKAEMDYCFTKMMAGEKVNPTWSEEDEDMLKSIIATCELAEQDRDSSPARHLLEMQTNWLKSLKERMKGD